MKLLSRRAALLLLTVTSLFLFQCTESAPQATNLGAEAALLKTHVDYLTVECYPRSVEYENNQEKAAKYIEQELSNAGAKVSRQAVPVQGRNFSNIIGSFPGSKKGVLIIGAHYDSCELTPGADDNASGVAGLLELAKLLKKYTPLHTIELVAYCNEEPPFFRSEHMGSAHHAKQMAEEKRNVIGMICLEMIGYYSDKPDSQDYPLDSFKKLYPTTGNFLAVVGDVNSTLLTKTVHDAMASTGKIPLVQLTSPNIPGLTIDFSDHLNYWEAGIPAVMLTDTAFYRNKQYHKKSDTSNTLDYEKMNGAVQSLFQAVKAVDRKGTELLVSPKE